MKARTFCGCAATHHAIAPNAPRKSARATRMRFASLFALVPSVAYIFARRLRSRKDQCGRHGEWGTNPEGGRRPYALIKHAKYQCSAGSVARPTTAPYVPSARPREGRDRRPTLAVDFRSFRRKHHKQQIKSIFAKGPLQVRNRQPTTGSAPKQPQFRLRALTKEERRLLSSQV